MDLRDELLAEVGPKTHVADLCRRAADEIMIKQMKIDQQAREIERLRGLLARYRDETPAGHQPHMIAQEVDAALGRSK